MFKFLKNKLRFFSAICLCIVAPFLVSSAQACEDVPARIALNFSFDWTLDAQQNLAQALVFECRPDLTVDDITAKLDEVLSANGVTVEAIEQFTIPNSSATSITNLVIYTPNDSMENRTVILPVMVKGRLMSTFVQHASLEGVAEEGKELILRFAVDARSVAEYNAQPTLEWWRDDVRIDGETRARYALSANDIDKTIAVDLVIKGPRGEEIARQRYMTDTRVAGVERPPEVKQLRILGDAEEGKRLTVGYQFADANSNDAEQGSRINWSRNGKKIKGATSQSYLLNKNDVGAEISVEITPKSNDGIEGKVARAELAEVIRPMKMAKGQQRSTLSLPSETIVAAIASNVSNGVKPSQSLTLNKVIEDVQKSAVLVPAAPPKKPAVVPQVKPRKTFALNGRKAVPHPPLPKAPPPKPVINVPAVPLTSREEAQVSASAKSGCFELEGIKLENSTIIDEAAQAILLDEFLNACTTPQVVSDVLSTLNNYYIDHGYVTTRAYVAPQDLKDGTLDIVIVEGLIEHISFYDDPDKDLHRIEFAFPVTKEDVLSINDLERGLDQMNVPASTRVTMNMIPGTKAGYSKIELTEEKIGPSYRFKMGLDNLGSQGTGEDRLTLGLDADHIFNYNDTWSISHIGSLDTNALAISGTVPKGYWTYGFSYSYSDYLNYIDANTQLFGKSETSEIKADRLYHKSRGNEFSFKSSLTKKTSKRTIGDVKLASQRMAVARLGVGFSQKTDAVFSGNVYVARGLEFFGAMRDDQDRAEGAPQAQFTKIQLDASYYKPIFANIFLQSALAGQASPSALYGSEQISAGGKTSVRGFARNTIAGDSGFYLQNDILFPMPQLLQKGPLREYIAAIKPFAGFDFAFVNDRALHKDNAIAGVGLGAKFAKGPITADLGLGLPLWRKNGSKNNKIEKYVKVLYQALEF